MTPQEMWTPSPARMRQSRLTAFASRVQAAHGLDASSYATLHRWSIDSADVFWTEVWDFCGVIGTRGARAIVDRDRMPGARFFPDASLSFAENVLRSRGPGPALIATTETGRDRTLSHDELRLAVGRAARALTAAGV